MRKEHTAEMLEPTGIPGGIAFEGNPFDEVFDEVEATEDETDGAFEPFTFDDNRIDVESVIALTARLAQVLAQEADYLGEMKIRDVGRIQREKTQLLEALEAQKRYIDRNPELLDEMDDNECLELAQIVEIFNKVLAENHRRLLVAREVNARVVEAIAEVVQEASKGARYDENGHCERDSRTVSMSLNQTI